MYVSPKMSVMTREAESGTYCPSAGCVANCEQHAVVNEIWRSER